MNKKILFVVDERKLGGVSVVLENLLNNLNLDKINVSILVLHNNGNCLENTDKRINIIYGSDTFDIIDQDFRSLIKQFKLIKALKKFNVLRKGEYIIYVNEKYISAAVGQKKINIKKFKELGFDCLIKADKNLKEKELRIERREK